MWSVSRGRGHLAGLFPASNSCWIQLLLPYYINIFLQNYYNQVARLININKLSVFLHEQLEENNQPLGGDSNSAFITQPDDVIYNPYMVLLIRDSDRPHAETVPWGPDAMDMGWSFSPQFDFHFYSTSQSGKSPAHEYSWLPPAVQAVPGDTRMGGGIILISSSWHWKGSRICTAYCRTRFLTKHTYWIVWFRSLWVRRNFVNPSVWHKHWKKSASFSSSFFSPPAV